MPNGDVQSEAAAAVESLRTVYNVADEEDTSSSSAGAAAAAAGRSMHEACELTSTTWGRSAPSVSAAAGCHLADVIGLNYNV